MKVAFYFAILLLLWQGCAQPAQPVAQMPDMSKEPITFLALGDSYTIGESVAESERWPVALAAGLTKAGIPVASPQIIATTGWTTADLQQGISKTATKPPYGLVSLLIGVNNQYRGYDIAIYRKEFQELLAQAITFAGGNKDRVFVVSIPDYGVTPFGASKDPEKIARELDQYNSLAQGFAAEAGVRFFNITPISREAVQDPALVAPDKLHPSGKMYGRWVNEILLAPLTQLLK